jgi:hypothetical protein
MMWLNYVIEDENAALVNFDEDDSFITNQSEDVVDWEAIEHDIMTRLQEQFPTIDFTFTSVRSANAGEDIADLKLNSSEFSDEVIQQTIENITEDLDLWESKYYE